MSNKRKRCVNCNTDNRNSKRRCTNCSYEFPLTQGNNRIFLQEIRKAGESGPVSPTLRLSIQNGADVNMLSSRIVPSTGLMEAAAAGNRHIVQFLIGLPAININQQTTFGRTALWFAANGGYHRCVEILLTTPSIAVNHQDVHGITALMVAARQGRHMTVQRLLQFERTDVNIQDEHGQTALFITAGLYRPRTITTMVHWHLRQRALGLNRCLDVNIQTDNGSTALMRAVTYNKPTNVMMLLSIHELNIVCMDNMGNTALTIPLIQKGAQNILRSWHRRMANRVHRWQYLARRKRRRREKGLSKYISRKKNTPHGPERHIGDFLQHSFIKLRF